MMEREFKYPVWGTQGGGLVRQIGDKYIFITKPDCPGLDVGDDMPEEWGVIPANWRAKQEMARHEFDDAGRNVKLAAIHYAAQHGVSLLAAHAMITSPCKVDENLSREE